MSAWGRLDAVSLVVVSTAGRESIALAAAYCCGRAEVVA